MAEERWVGVDFGTTNSAVALADASGDVSVVDFAGGPTFRSVLHFLCAERPGRPPSIEAGGAAIARYVEAGTEGRLIQSAKSFLASRAFRETTICDQSWSLEQLIGLLLERLRRAAEEQVGALGRRAAVGRPVHFAGPGRPGDDELAESRLRAALGRAGFDEVTFVLEPVAAAYDYERRLDHEELVLIADFGGGTSDFSLLRVGPTARRDGARRLLASDGVGIAGDAFDAQIVRHAVSPALGRGTQYDVAKGLEVPLWIFGHLEQWHTLSFLKTPRVLRLLRRLEHEAVEPEKIAALLHLVDYDLGFALYQAVDDAKRALSQAEVVELGFVEPPIRVRHVITRPAFDAWIARELAAIAAAADRTLRAAGVEAGAVDRVFMTGGSSFVPGVRRLFEERFGPDRLRGGGEFVSVARGLAMCSRELA